MAITHEVGESGETEPLTFTRDEFRDNPSAVMRAVVASPTGRVLVTDADGQPHITLSRQTEDL